ncbi:protein kinase regulator [Fragilaria crotonensis]|nr:protein kinase regulator [Fragilaria crotonensis]
MTTRFSCLAIAFVATWFFLSNADASSDYSRAPARQSGQRKGMRNVSEKKQRRQQVLIDLSDFDPIDIMDNEEEERLLSLLESIDREEVKIVSEKRKSKKTMKSKRKRVKRGESVALMQNRPTNDPPHPAIERAVNVTTSFEMPLNPQLQSSPLDASPGRADLNSSSTGHADPKKELHIVEDTKIVTESSRSVSVAEGQDEIERQIPMSIQRILDTGDRITQPIVQQRLDSPEVQQPIEQPLRHENSLPYLPQSPTFSHHNPQPRLQKTHKLSMLEQRAAMLSYTTPWVIDFLQSRPNDALLAVPRDFLGDGFNLVHLPPLVERFVGSVDLSFPLYKAALRLILSNEQLSDIPPLVQQAAEILYALIHGRFVTSPRGLDTLRRTLMHHKEIFGKCPRPSCRGMPMLPHGDSIPGRNAQRYCFSCGQVWEWWDSKVDGSAWGPSLCHLYLLTYGKGLLGGVGSMPQQNPTATVPTIFGFQVHSAALRRLHEH